MTDMIWSRVQAFGDSIVIETPKDAPDAQHVHTVKFFAAINELRRREADRVHDFNEWAAEHLYKPLEIYSRENPGGLIRGSKYLGNERIWRPVLPFQRWKAPKPLNDKDARIKAQKIRDKDYAPRSPGTMPTEATPDKFQLISWEES